MIARTNATTFTRVALFGKPTSVNPPPRQLNVGLDKVGHAHTSDHTLLLGLAEVVDRPHVASPLWLEDRCDSRRPGVEPASISGQSSARLGERHLRGGPRQEARCGQPELAAIHLMRLALVERRARERIVESPQPPLNFRPCFRRPGSLDGRGSPIPIHTTPGWRRPPSRRRPPR